MPIISLPGANPRLPEHKNADFVLGLGLGGFGIGVLGLETLVLGARD